MKYLLLISHATIAQGIASALEMLLGSRPFVRACGMEEGMAPDEFRAELSRTLASVTADDEVVILSDIGGGSPFKSALAVLEDKGLGNAIMAFGGANLPMAIAAVMGIEDGLGMDAIHDAVLSEGAQAVRQL